MFAAIFFKFSIVIIKLGQPVFLTVKTHGLGPHKNEAQRMPRVAIPVCFPCLTKFQSTFSLWILKNGFSLSNR